MNSCENHLFPGSAATLGQEGHFLHIPVQGWSCLLCVAQSKIRAKLGRGPSAAACLPQALFYIFIVWGQKRLPAVLRQEFRLGFPHPSLLGGQRGNPRSSYGLFSPLTGRRKDPGGEKPFVLNIPQQVPVTGSQVPQPIPKLRTPCIYLHPASLSHLPVSLLALPPHEVCQAAVGPAGARKVTCGTGR